MNSILRNLVRGDKRIFFGSIAVLLVVLPALTFVSMQGESSVAPVDKNMSSEDQVKPITYTTISPQLISESSSVLLLGTVLSHETANIYPRRDGIVEDIYIDIGDTVEKNQIVALLLPKGVEGVSAANIAQKQAMHTQANSDYVSAQAVKDETMITSQQKISEKETDLRIARSEQIALVTRFAEYEENIVQKRDQAFTAVRSSRQIIEQILVGSNSRAGAGIYEVDILNHLGLLDFQTRYDVIPPFDQLYTMEQAYLSSNKAMQFHLLPKLFTLADSALTSTLTILASTPTVPTPQPGKMTQERLGVLTTSLLNSQSAILKAKEGYQDAQSMFDTVVSSEPDLYSAYKTGNTYAAKSNKVQMMELQLETAQKNFGLTKANQEQIVERNRTMLGVSNAMLETEVTQSGHREIRSPFAGTVSKRFINVGNIVKPSMLAFELTNVPTSLAKKAKAEVQFGLPEHLISAIEVGNIVTFFLQANETKEYTAEVTRKSPQVDVQTHTIAVQAKIPDELNFPHQSSVRVHISDEGRAVFRVPSSAVKREDGTNYLWILDEDTPIKVAVSVIAEEGEFAEVTGEITEDTSVVLDPPDLF